MSAPLTAAAVPARTPLPARAPDPARATPPDVGPDRLSAPTRPGHLRRVAWVCTDPGIPVFGHKGASVHAQAVLRVLHRHGVELHVVCVRSGGEPPADLADVVVHRLPEVGRGEPVERERRAQRSDAAAAAVLDAISADGGLDLVYERYSLWGRTATAWARRHGVPSLLEVNAPLVDEQRAHRALVDVDGAERVAREALGAADAAVCVSEAVAAWARPLAGAATTVAVVPNGVDTARVTPPPGPVRGGEAPGFTVGFVGTLKPWHGVDRLLQASALLLRDPGYRVLVVGDGPEADVIDDLAQALRIEQAVERVGAVPPDDVPGLLRRMDVAVAPYPGTDDVYFSPLKVYEYLAAGLPVVASAVGVLPELLEHGRWGELVPPDDPAALASAIAGLRADAARRQRIRDDAPAHMHAHDWEHVVRAALRLLDLDLTEVATHG